MLQVLILQLVDQFAVCKWCNEIKAETLIKFAICVVFLLFVVLTYQSKWECNNLFNCRIIKGGI